MGSRPRTTAEAERAYDDFAPSTEWTQESAAGTLTVYLPGFRKEQLKVQVTSKRNLRITGERPVSGNKWSRFREEIPISANYDTNGIGAKFEKGILFVKLPKINVPARPQKGKEQPPREAPNTQKATQEKAEAPKPDKKAPQEKSQPPARVPKPDQKAQQEKAQPPAPVPKPDQKPPQDKAQPSAQVPKPYQKTRQENVRSTAEAANAKISPVPESVQPSGGKPSQEKDKRLAGDAKPEKPRGEPEGQVPDPKTGTDNKKSGQKDKVANANAALQKVAMEDKDEIIYEGKVHNNGQSEAGNVVDAASTSVKLEKIEDSVHGTAKKDKDKTSAVIAAGNGKFAKGNYRQVLVDLAMELKKPRKPINVVMAILSVVVFVLYVVQAIRSLRQVF